MSLTRRSLLKRTAGVAGSLVFADVLGVIRVGDANATQCTPVYRSQFDGSYACCTNCGPASVAMLRSAQSCGAYSPSAASMRIWVNRRRYGTDCGPASQLCGCKTSNCGTQSWAPPGTAPLHWYKALVNPYDGGPLYATALFSSVSHTCANAPRTLTQFKTLLTPNGPGGDYSGAVVVSYPSMPARHQCDSVSGAHAVFVRYYSTASGFLVYDPDNANGCAQPRWWTESEFWTAANAYLGNGIHCVVGKNLVTTPCPAPNIGESN